MTHQMEMRFHCDRCATEINIAYQNTPQLLPQGWLQFRITEAIAPTHLCDVCAMVFENFMKQRI